MKKALTAGVYWDTRHENKCTIFECPETGSFKKYFKDGDFFMVENFTPSDLIPYKEYLKGKSNIFDLSNRLLYNKDTKELVLSLGREKGGRFECLHTQPPHKFADFNIWEEADPLKWEDVTEKILKALSKKK